MALPLLATACAEEPPELQVGPVAFHEDDLRGLGPDWERTLAAVTALGVVVAEDRVREVGDPLGARAERRELRRMLRDQVILDAAGLEEEDLRERYREDPDRELVVRHILKEADEAAPQARRDEARSRAERARERALDGEPFAELAAELSHEPGADERGGRLEPGREGTWVEPFWEAALELEEGEVSDVVETMFGFHVIRLEERRTVPFEEARGRVLAELADEVEVPHDWEDRVAEARESIQVSSSALDDWEAGAGEGSGDEGAGPELARWDDGSLTAGEFEAYAATLDDPRYRELQDDRGALETEVREAALEHLLAGAAGERNLAAPAAVREEAVLEWSRDAQGWTGVMGFREGLPPDEVRRRALEAVGATGQSADLARRGVRERFPLLRHGVGVERPAESEDDGR